MGRLTWNFLHKIPRDNFNKIFFEGENPTGVMSVMPLPVIDVIRWHKMAWRRLHREG